MKTSPDEPKGSPALRELSKLRRDALDVPTRVELDRGLNGLYARIAAKPARRRRAWGWSTVALSVAIGVILALQLGRGRYRLGAAEAPPLAYRIEGGSVLEGGYLKEASNAGIKLLFNEGSQVVLAPGARGRLRAVERDGARVAIDQGAASFQVTPSHERRWWVEVGPFSVAVKGTVFTVDWQPSSEQFVLALRHGRVVVSGPLPGGDITLRSGQRLSVNLPQAETVITEDPSEALRGDAGGSAALQARPSALSSPPSGPTVGAGSVSSGPMLGAGSVSSGPTVGAASVSSGPMLGAASVSAPLSRSRAKTESKGGWAKQLASGEWDGILADAEGAGIAATLADASSEDLFALATAARYRRRTDLARAALLAVRSRFPDTPRALDASFFLGRVEEGRDSGAARAIDWYDEYLTRSPDGAYAAEALGRKMILTDERDGHAAARPLAAEYLRRFPGGSYAGSARVLSQVP